MNASGATNTAAASDREPDDANLLACPFCGDQEPILTWSFLASAYQCPAYSGCVMCRRCDGTMHVENSGRGWKTRNGAMRAAIKAWNRRAIAAALRVRGKA